VIPCDHRRYESQARHSHIIYSDDGGGNWKIGGSAQPDTNECAIVELRDGALMLNMRSYAGRNRRAIALSRDGGITWAGFRLEDQLIEPVCQASLIRYDSRHLLFSNPASTRRERLIVRASINDGRTWLAARLLHDGPAAYSSLAVLPDRKIACLYECGTGSAYETITLARFSLSWLMNGSNI
jgi:sialidase-1